MDNLTPWQIVVIVAGLIMGAAAVINTLGSAAEKIVKAWRAAKAPNAQQDKRLEAVEADLRKVHEYLEIDKRRLDTQDESNRVTQRALLALLAHGIDGNHVEQMESAKLELQNHLINR